MKNKIREWGFPVALIVSWMFVTAFVATRLVEANQAHAVPAISQRT